VRRRGDGGERCLGVRVNCVRTASPAVGVVFVNICRSWQLPEVMTLTSIAAIEKFARSLEGKNTPANSAKVGRGSVNFVYTE